MEKRRTAVKRRKGITLFLLALVCCLTVIFCFSGGYSSARAVDEDNEAASKTDTGYYMDADMSNISEAWLTTKDGPFRFCLKAWNRSNVDITVLLLFTKIKDPVNDKPIFITTHSETNLPAGNSFGMSVNLGKIHVNLRETYYDILKDGDYSGVKITLYYDGQGVPLETNGKSQLFSLTNVKVDTGPIEPGVGDNGGTDQNPAPDENERVIAGFEKFFDWLTGIFEWSITYATFKKGCVIAVAVIGALLVISFFYKLFKK